MTQPRESAAERLARFNRELQADVTPTTSPILQPQVEPTQPAFVPNVFQQPQQQPRLLGPDAFQLQPAHQLDDIFGQRGSVAQRSQRESFIDDPLVRRDAGFPISSSAINIDADEEDEPFASAPQAIQPRLFAPQQFQQLPFQGERQFAQQSFDISSSVPVSSFGAPRQFQRLELPSPPPEEEFTERKIEEASPTPSEIAFEEAQERAFALDPIFGQFALGAINDEGLRPDLTHSRTQRVALHEGFGDPRAEFDDELEEAARDIQVRLGDEQLTVEGVERFAHGNAVAEFSNPNFNQQLIGQALNRNLDQFGAISDREGLDRDLKRVFSEGLKGALQSDAPANAVLGAISTIGRSLRQNAGDLDPLVRFEVDESVNMALFSLIGESYLRELSFQPIRIPRILGEIFTRDLDRLQEQNLNIDEIRSISEEFNRELSQVRQFTGFSDFTDQLSGIRGYVNDNVANDLLRATIISNIDKSIAAHQQLQESRIGSEPFIIEPQSLQRSILINDGNLNEIANSIKSQLRSLDEELIVSALGQTTLPAIQAVNDLARRYNITIPNNVPLPGDAEKFVLAPEDFIDLPPDPDRKRLVLPADPNISTADLKKVLTSALAMFESKQVQFAYNPIMAPDVNLQQTDQLITDIRKMFDEKNVSRKSARLNPSSTTNIGNIQVGRLVDNRRIITVPPETMVSDLMILVFTLLKEPGTLADPSGFPMIKIGKGVGHRKLLDFIMGLQRKNMGSTFTMIYMPDSAVGGLFLDSALSRIRTGKKLLGGAILKPTGVDTEDLTRIISNMPMVRLTRYM